MFLAFKKGLFKFYAKKVLLLIVSFCDICKLKFHPSDNGAGKKGNWF
jgi:hypothetical protein